MASGPREGWEPWRPGVVPELPGLPRVIGHRGAALHAPENTIAGIRVAHALGAKWVEFDVKLSRDGVPILMHDETVDRTTTARGLVVDLDALTLRRLDAGSRFGPAFAGEPVPTLREALELLAELGMGVNVEIKPCPGHEAQTAEAAARVIRETWSPQGQPLLVSSFALHSLVTIRRVAPELPVGVLIERVPRNWASLMTELGGTTLHPWYRPMRSATVRELAMQGVPVLLYTVNDAARAERLLQAGARGIITDAPDRILPVA